MDRAAVLAAARRVRLVGFDIDGVLTDGRLHYDDDGGESKSFHVHDGLGLKLLAAAGIETVVISARHSAAAARRLRELGIGEVHLGVGNKLEVFDALRQARALSWADCAYMGDDLPDLAVLQRVAVAATVADATPTIRALAHWIAERDGGRGAVREFAEWLLQAQGRWEQVLAPFRGPAA